MLGDPIDIGAFKGLDLVLRDPIELLARNVVVDLRGTLAVRAVGAAQVRGIRNPCGTLFPGSTAEAVSLSTWAIELAGTALGAVTEATALSVAFATRTITKRLTITITLTARALTKGFAVPVTEATALSVAFATRTVTKRLTVAIALTARAL
ncbi:hypothetical protein, partial [Arthrobacter sp. efr-133-R2A-120]|uniref:hypothetical protein n=1 Tax=Arthrobacter sp. efr-133-R2A-120 TaxID=3040277 RepID=UPI00254B4916